MITDDGHNSRNEYLANMRLPLLEGGLNEEIPIGRAQYLLYSLATTAYLLDLAIRWVQKSPDDQIWARRIGQTRVGRALWLKKGYPQIGGRNDVSH